MGIALKHLSESERKAIAQDLFKVTSTEEQKGELHGLCPIHQETNPSFSYNFKKDQYHCFSCGADGDLLKLWSEVHGHAQKEGFKAFCDAFRIEHGKHSQRRAPAAKDRGGGPPDPAPDLEWVWEKFPPLPEDWVQRLEKTRGWKRRWIFILDLRLQTFYRDKSGGLRPVKDPDRVAIPIRDRDGNIVNIRLWRPTGGMPKIISWAKTTGSSRLFPPIPLYFDPRYSPLALDGVHLEECLAPETVLLCEGESDTVCALSQGFNAITQTTKLSKWPEDHLAVLKDRDVVIAYDADLPGVKYADHAARNLAGVARSVRILAWPDFMGRQPDGAWPAKHGEDLTDFFVKHGKKPEDLLTLIEAAVPFDAGSTAPPSASAAGDSDSSGINQFFEYGINKRYSFKPRLLAEKILKDMTLLSDPDTGLLYKWTGKYWEIFDEDHIKALAIRHLENESQKSRVEDAIYQVRSLATIPHGRKVNDRMDWICLQNGMLNLHTFEMQSHDPSFCFTQILPVSFDPESEQRCARFEKYLETNIVTPEVIAQMQEYAGYCLVRHAKYEKCLLLLGPGADGKSKFMAVLRELVGHDNCAAVSFLELENEFHRSSLYGKLLNVSTEIGSQAIESSYFKAITSGDTINGAFKHKDVFEFTPYCKLVFAGNMLPRVKDNSEGFFRRMLPIQFKRQFKEDDPERDPHLMDKFRGELSEIFYWALCGLKRLEEQGRFTDCDETRALIMGYRRSNNPILCYVEDECVIGEDKEVAKADILLDYQKYCAKNGYKALGRENFFRELYVAVHNLRLYRPRSPDGVREYKIQGIGILGTYNKGE